MHVARARGHSQHGMGGDDGCGDHGSQSGQERHVVRTPPSHDEICPCSEGMVLRHQVGDATKRSQAAPGKRLF